MRYFAPAFAFALLCLAPAAHAQSVPGAQSSGPAPPPREITPDIAPPALPGAGTETGIATAPKVQTQNTGDPTTQLFTAVNTNDYNSAQDAISRGADLTAENSLGETALEMAIDLNQNSITFLILSARNEDGDNAPPAQQATASAPAHGARRHQPVAAAYTPPRAAVPLPQRHLGNNPGTPNPNAGFLGFGQ